MSEHIDRETGEIVSVNYRRSTELNELFSALAKAQTVFAAAERAGENKFLKKEGTGKAHTYATLESVLEATKEGRDKNSLAIIQMPGNTGENIAITTLLGHSSGQWIESSFAVRPNKFDAQGAGSVITYLRRYALMAVLGIAPEDDDGEAASIQQPITKGVTRTAAPRSITAVTPPATSAEGSPGPSSTGNGAQPKRIAEFLARPSYEIDRSMFVSWSKWEEYYLKIADHADNLDQLLKLDEDNKEQCDAFAKAHVAAVYNNFCARVKANAKRIVIATRQPAPEFVGEADADTLLQRMRQGEPV
jgi:hypothetical protein